MSETLYHSTLTAITGGIGAGKSIVSHILAVMGYEVYDCDIQAKQLMDSSDAIKERIAAEIATEAISENGDIDRATLASIVFEDKVKLATLNAIVHGAVIDHMLKWRDSHNNSKRLFVETAILYQSGIDHHVDDVWNVIAPDELRISRVMRRNSLGRSAVKQRISSQTFIPETPHPNIHTIINDNYTPLLPQIHMLL